MISDHQTALPEIENGGNFPGVKTILPFQTWVLLFKDLFLLHLRIFCLAIAEPWSETWCYTVPMSLLAPDSYKRRPPQLAQQLVKYVEEIEVAGLTIANCSVTVTIMFNHIWAFLNRIVFCFNIWQLCHRCLTIRTILLQRVLSLLSLVIILIVLHDFL